MEILGCKNFSNQARLDWSKTVEFGTVLQTKEANMVSNPQRVSGELSISQSSEVCQLRNLSKSIQSCQIVPHVLPKYCKTFDSLY